MFWSCEISFAQWSNARQKNSNGPKKFRRPQTIFERVMSQIDWTTGQKYLCITPNTWAIKSKSARLEAAKADPRAAGHVVDAQLLNDNRLNTVFYKLDKAVKAQYLSQRAMQTNVKCAPSVPAKSEAADSRKRTKSSERREGTFRREGNFRLFFFFLHLFDRDAGQRQSRQLPGSRWAFFRGRRKRRRF